MITTVTKKIMEMEGKRDGRISICKNKKEENKRNRRTKERKEGGGTEEKEGEEL